MGKIIVAGHVCLDVTPVFAVDRPLPLNEVIVPGKLLQMRDVIISGGGVVANTGLALKVLGAETRFMGKIGRDEFGRILSGIFARFGAQNDLTVCDNSSTSFSVVVAPPGTDRVFLHNPGGNHTFCLEDIDLDAVRGAAVFHFGYPPLMRSMYENGGRELLRIFGAVKAAGTPTSLDMAYVDPDSDAAKADWADIVRRVLPLTDIFAPSFEEICSMVDPETYHRLLGKSHGEDISRHLSLSRDLLPLAAKLLTMGAKIILLKCGEAGILLKTAGRGVLSQAGPLFDGWEDLEIFKPSYKPSRLLSACGAGDASIAGFLKGFTDGLPPHRCLACAAAAGACRVEAYDVFSGLPSFERLIERIDNGWEEQNIIKE